MSAWQPSASADALARRSELLARVRSFFSQRGVLEVQTPVLTASGVTDVHIESVAVDDPPGWLRTSPEHCHKRLLAAGLGDLYELGPVFRRGEAGRHHQPEFTLLEWYRVGWTWQALAEEVVELISCCLPETERRRDVRWRSWRSCFEDALDIDALTADDHDIARCADDAPAGLDRDALLDWLFATRIQPGFGADVITVVHDYPASQAALARLSTGDPRVAERFEVFLGSLELGNGYHELCDAGEQRARFERDKEARRLRGQPAMPVDESILAALAAGLPDCAGVALGFDRLVMAALGAPTIEQAVSFSHPSSR